VELAGEGGAGQTSPAVATADHANSATAVVAREDPDLETRGISRRRLVINFVSLAGAAAFAKLVTGIKYEWWHWMMPGLWAGLAALMAIRQLSLPALRVCRHGILECHDSPLATEQRFDIEQSAYPLPT
jgi:hypothetical protein